MNIPLKPGQVVVLPEGMTPKDYVVADRPNTDVEEAMKHYYNRDAQSLEQLIRQLVHKSQQP